MRRFAVACVLLLSSAFSQAACYSVYDGGGVLLLRTEQAPVDLQYRIGDVVREKFGDGASMVFVANGEDCNSVGEPNREPNLNGRGFGSVGAMPIATYTGAAAVYGAGRYVGSGYGGFGRVGSAAYPHVGPRGGQFRYTASGNKSYRRR